METMDRCYRHKYYNGVLYNSVGRMHQQIFLFTLLSLCYDVITVFIHLNAQLIRLWTVECWVLDLFTSRVYHFRREKTGNATSVKVPEPVQQPVNLSVGFIGPVGQELHTRALILDPHILNPDLFPADCLYSKWTFPPLDLLPVY